ncbi:MAG: hypothetical protein ABSH39_13665 [Candidatus Acidiferrum sp.]
MFCPQCKAEYRQGFTRCADCDVELVSELTPEALAKEETATPGDPNEDPFCSFWEGEDPRIHSEICQVLDEQNIPHKTLRRRDHLFNFSAKSEFQMGVPYSFFERAEAAVKEAYDSEAEPEEPREASDEQPSPLELPESTRTGSDVPSRDGASRHQYLEDANIQVWSSEHLSPGNIISMSLKENLIPHRFDRRQGNNAIFVFPDDESRSREIVREVVEGVPPE